MTMWKHRGLLKWIVGETMFYSIVFTWLLPQIRFELSHTDLFVRNAVVGGPAIELMPHYFADMPHVRKGTKIEGLLQRHNPLATRTTTGCPNKCSFCAVPKTEGVFCELKEWLNLPVICDNNLLAASDVHFDMVCNKLELLSWCDFNQGLDARLLTDYHADRLARLPMATIRLALDADAGREAWENTFTQRTCVECGKFIDLSDERTFKTLMHHGLHRYVCSEKCMFDFYKQP